MARTIRQSDFAPRDNKNDFVPQDLIEKLTKTVDLKEEQSESSKSAAARKGFIPRPYLLKFENAIDQIRTLRSSVDEEINAQTSICREDESLYKSSLSGFMTDLQKIMHDFRILDGGISKVSQTAIRIGDRLENVEEQRQQILESEELIEHFLRFNKDAKYRDIDPIFYSEQGEELYRSARLIIKLSEIGTDLTLPETANARSEITSISNRIRRNLKEEFIRAYRSAREDNYIEMRECAYILYEFNDSKEAFNEFLDLYLRDINFNKYPSTSLREVNQSIKQFISDLLRVIETAMVSIYKVFPKPELIIKDLIIKTFREQILKYLQNATQPILLGNELDSKLDNDNNNNNVDFFEIQRTPNLRGQSIGDGGGDLFDRLSKKELNEYLSIIDIVYLNTSNLLSEISGKLFELMNDASNNKESESSKQQCSSSNNNNMIRMSIKHILSKQSLLWIIFKQHELNYLKLEIKHLRFTLKELIREHVIEPLKLEEDDDINNNQNEEDNNNQNEPQQQELKTNISEFNYNNMLAVIKQSKNAAIHSGRKLTVTTRTYSQKKLKTMKKMLPKSMSSKEFEEMMGRLRNVFQFGINECVATMKKRVSISLLRCVNICAKSELSKSIHKLFLIYLDSIDYLFRKTLIPICRETLPRNCGKPNLRNAVREIKHWYFLEAVHHTNSALQLVEQCFINDVSPYITDTFEYSICKEDKNQIYNLFQIQILAGLKELLNCGLNIIDTILKKEQNQKIDFKPKQDDITNLSHTNACKLACQFIDQFRGRSLICLDGRNLDRFFLCLGTRLFYNIISHFKEYTYNNTGAMILVLDAKKYQHTVKEFHIEKINELFLILVERTNLISIPADSIKPYIQQDQKLSKITKNELKQWLKLRSDYKSAKIEQKLFND